MVRSAYNPFGGSSGLPQGGSSVDPRITAPGDPNFVAGRYDPYAQFPAAAAQSRLISNQDKAQKLQALMAQLGLQPNDQVAQIAQQGYETPDRSFFERVLGVISAPFRVVNTALQETISGQNDWGTVGRVAAQGAEDLGNLIPGIAHFVPNQNIIDLKALKRKTGIEPGSTSRTLELLGWKEQKTWQGKIVRGMADFGLSVLIDPITYITGGAAGLGRKLLGEEGIKVVDQMTARVLAGEAATGMEKSVLPKVAEWTAKENELRVSMWMDRGLPEAIARDVVSSPAHQEAIANTVAMRVRNLFADELLPPLLNKDFSKLAAVGEKYGNDVLEQLPLFARGGLRITFPFGKQALEGGLYIPGTRGLGRKILREPIAKIAERAGELQSLAPIAKWIRDLHTGSDFWASLLTGVKKGELKGHQYLLLRDWYEGYALKTDLSKKMANLNIMQDATASLWNDLTKQVRGTMGRIEGSPSTWDDMKRVITNALSSPDPAKHDIGGAIEALMPGAKPETVQQLDQTIRAFVDIHNSWKNDKIDQIIETLRKIGASDRDIATWEAMRNRVVQVLHPNGRKLIDAMAQKGLKIDEELSKMASRGGEEGYAALLTGSIIDGVSHGGAAEAQFSNATSRMAEMRYGEHVIFPPMDGQGTVLMDRQFVSKTSANGEQAASDLVNLARGSEVAVFSPVELNDRVEKYLEKLASDHGIVIRAKGGANPFRPFEEDPFQLTAQFMNEIADVRAHLELGWTLRQAGLMHKATQYADYQKGIVNWVTAVKNSADQIEEMFSTLDPGVHTKEGRARVIKPFRKLVSRQQAMGTVSAEYRQALGEGQTVERALLGANDPTGRVVLGTAQSDTVEMGRQLSARPVSEQLATGQTVEVVDPAKVKIPEVPSMSAKSNKSRMIVRGRWGKIPAPRRRAIEASAREMARMQGKDLVEFVQIGSGRTTMIMPTKILPELSALGGFHGEMEDYANAARYIANALNEGGSPSEVQYIRNWLAESFGHGDVKAGREVIAQIERSDKPLMDYADAVQQFYELSDQIIGNRVRRFERIPGSEGYYVPYDGELMALNPEPALKQQPVFVGEQAAARERLLNVVRELGTPEAPFIGARLSKEDIAHLDELKRLSQENLKDVGLDPNLLDAANAMTYVRGPDGYVNTMAFSLGGSALKDVRVEEFTTKFLHQIINNMQAVYSPIGLAQLRESSNGIIRWWKGMATVTRPTFHIRNLLGGIWNNQIIGVRMRDYAAVRNSMIELRRAMVGGDKLSFEEALAKVSNKEMRPVIKAAWDSGLLNSSFARAEYRNVTQEYRKNFGDILRLANPLNGDKFAPVQAGALAMESIEDFLRLAAFTRWYDPAVKGSENVAREMALAVHFDYQHLTKFETWVKQFVPFFVWQRRNLPLQLQVMLERPGLMNRYTHLMDAVRGEFPQQIPQSDYAGSEYWSGQVVGTDVVLNQGSPFWARVMFDPDLPTQDLLALDPMHPAEALQHYLGLLGPMFSVPWQIAQQGDYGDVNAPAPLDQITRQLAIHGLWDEASPGQIPYSLNTVFNTAFPWYNELVTPLTGASQPNAAEAFGGGGVLQRELLTLGKGIGLRTQTPAQSRSAAYQGNATLDQLMKKLRLSDLLQSPEQEARIRMMTSGK